MAKVGRPTTYTPDLGDKICKSIARGNSLVKTCKAKGMPDESSVYKWRRELPEFSQNYARAREDAADVFAEEIIEIADDAPIEEIQKAKLRTDTRKWVASRFNRAYQDNSTVTVKKSIADMDEDERLARIRELQQKAKESAE